MKIDFNNVRKQAVFSYAKLVTLLNHATDENRIIQIDACDLDEVMQDLRNELISIACSYIPDDPDCRSLAGEIGEVPVFFEEG